MDLPFRMVCRVSFPSILLLLGEAGMLFGVLVASSSPFWPFRWMLNQLGEKVPDLRSFHSQNRCCLSLDYCRDNHLDC